MPMSFFFNALVVLVVARLAEGQNLIRQAPNDGDSCTRYTLTSPVPELARVLRQRAAVYPCPPGLVVNSAGQCVAAQDSDRCQQTVVFNQNYISNKCAANPTLKFSDPFSCANYYDCSVGQTSIGCPVGQLYDDVSKQCKSFTEVYCGERAVKYTPQQLQQLCSLYPNRVMAQTNLCNSYYNCSQSEDVHGRLAPYHAECPYLTLLDVETKTCLPFHQVRCGDRREIKNPCDSDLKQFQCGRSSHCRPCFVDQPDCTNLPDGDNSFPGQPFTPKYARCFQGRALGTGTCVPVSTTEPRLFDPRVGGCAPSYSIPRSLGGTGPDY